LDATQGDESGEDVGEIFVVLGLASVSVEPRKGAFADPEAREDDEALHGIGV
jgi:hypothetical protein